MGGYVLTPNEVASYSDLKEPGRIVIERDAKGRVLCHVSGFKFDSLPSCRENATKAMMWGRDVLDAAVQADILVPGGDIVSVVD